MTPYLLNTYLKQGIVDKLKVSWKITYIEPEVVNITRKQAVKSWMALKCQWTHGECYATALMESVTEVNSL